MIKKYYLKNPKLNSSLSLALYYLLILAKTLKTSLLFNILLKKFKIYIY